MEINDWSDEQDRVQIEQIIRDIEMGQPEKRSSAGYPAAMLAVWLALERRSFSLVDTLDFIVTVNIEPPQTRRNLMTGLAGGP